MAEKKYYWLKMTDQFFEDKAIKKLRKIAGGDTYTIIYLKMLLTAIKQGNKMYFEGIEDDFMEELALELDEDTDNVKVSLIQIPLIEHFTKWQDFCKISNGFFVSLHNLCSLFFLLRSLKGFYLFINLCRLLLDKIGDFLQLFLKFCVWLVDNLFHLFSALINIFSMENLYGALEDASDQRRYNKDVMLFNFNAWDNLKEIRDSVYDGTYTIDKYYIFYVYEPKKRMIMSIKFKHRVVQWAIYRVINPMLIKGYIKDSYGCIPERGPLTAMFRLKYWLEQVNRKDEQWYYLKLDISKYFYRISHRILKKILAKKIKDQRLLKLLESIIDCKHTPFGLPPGRSPGEVPLEERLFDVGMPIGNLLSQVFANVYLDALDQFCKRELQIHCYVRYMDDVIILSSSKAQLQEWKVRIASFLETELELQLNNKTCIRPINQGIEFVGYRVWPDKVVLRKKTTLHIKRVLKAKKEAYRVKEISFKQATDTLQSYLGMMKYCDCDALKEKILDDFVLTHADMKQIYEEGGDRDENYYRRGDGWSVEDYPVTDETYRPAGTCITAAWNY